MNLDMLEQSRPASAADLDRVRAIVGRRHADWVSFLAQSDGSIPAPNRFHVGAVTEAGVPANTDCVSEFWSIAEVVEQRRLLSDRLDSRYLAIAVTVTGNYICLGISADASAVFFWDHEVETAIAVCESFDEFMMSVQPFDGADLEPPDVIEVWVDPALLAKMKEE